MAAVKLVKENLYWYVVMLAISWVLVAIALGPGLFGTYQANTNWQVLFFDLLCHQNPMRTYIFNGQFMAVCSRSFGIYFSFAFGLILLPVFLRWVLLSPKQSIWLVLATIALNTVDVVGNLLGVWQNSLHSRFILGATFGIAVAILLSDLFFKKLKLTENNYGR